MNQLNIFKKIAFGLLLSLSFLSETYAQCSTSNEVSITVVNDPTISITGAVTICSGGTATLTATPAGGTGTCTIQWQSSPDGSTGWADISGANSTTYAPVSLTTTTYYRTTYSCTGTDCNSATSNVQALTVVPNMTVQTQPQPITECVGGTKSMSVVLTGGSGTGTVAYTWEQSASGSGGWSAAPGATNSATYTPPSTTAGTMYYRVTASATGNGCTSVTSSNAQVDIIPDMTVQTQPQPITECVGGTTSMSVVLTSGTGTGTISYTWEQSASGSGGWSAASGATNSATYTPPSATAGTMYYRVTASATGDGCGSVTSSNAQVNIIPDMTVQTQPQPITECVGGTLSMNVILTSGTGTGTVSYTWEQSTTGSSGWSAASGATNSATYTPPSATAGTIYYRVTASATGDGCGSVISVNAQVDIIPNLTVQTQPQPITECVGGTTSMSVVLTGGSGTGTVSYTWEQSATGSGGWSAASGATNSATYTPPSTTAGTMYYHVIASATGNGCSSTTSNNAQVDIIPDIVITAQPQDITECLDGTIALSVTTTGGIGTTYTWEQSATGTGGWSAAPGITNAATYTPPSTAAGTLYYRVVVSSAGNGCGPQTSTTATVVVVAKPSVAVTTPNQIVCIGAVLTLNATPSGGTGTCGIQWQDSTDGGSSWNPISGATNNTYTTAPLGANTKYHATFTCNGNGCCN